jgi:hypothetical protein
MISLEKLCEIINTNFGEPFLVKDGVSAEISEYEGKKELTIAIGRRDIQIDENGELVGSGTFVGMADDTLSFNEEDL